MPNAFDMSRSDGEARVRKKADRYVNIDGSIALQTMRHHDRFTSIGFAGMMRARGINICPFLMRVVFASVVMYVRFGSP